MDAPDAVGAALIGILEGADDGERVIRQANTPTYGVVMKVITQLVEIRGAIIHFVPSLTGKWSKEHPSSFSGQPDALFILYLKFGGYASSFLESKYS
jgi:hypothetical protein